MFIWTVPLVTASPTLRPVDERAGSTQGKRGSGRDWREVYSVRLIVTDLAVQVWVVFGVQTLWFGGDAPDVAFRGSALGGVLTYSIVSALVVGAWMAGLSIYGTRGYRVLGTGSEEYRLIIDVSLRLFGIIAILAFLVQVDIARGYLLISFPLGVAALVLSRWMWRQWLKVQRMHGNFSSTVLLVGSASSAAHIAKQLASKTDAGYLVVGACLPPRENTDLLPGTGVPVFGDFDSLLDSLERSGADTVIITSSDDLPPERVRELSWSLEPGRKHLVMAPNLTDIGGPRIHTRPVAGLPLIHVETPRYEGRKQFSKRTFDVVCSGVLLAVLSPLLLALALVVKCTSRGPVFYRQARIGLNGDEFGMLKFRSMIVDADHQLAALLQAQGTADRPLFKVTNDPRLTRAGAVLRKYSLDEFPQLVNVFLGSMSLVGPRPQREGEVALYDAAAHRRLYVKPGMSGLWQVSGRSNLSWDDSIRLDLYYVENWSLTGDIVILFRTLRAVIAPEGGAY